MISAFGVEHGQDIAKRQARQTRHGGKDASGAAIAGGGGVVGTTGLVGGGIPGFKSDSETIANVRRGSWKQRTGAALSSGRGGVFGYRTDAHQGALDRFKADEAKHAASKIGRSDSFLRGRGSGKIGPEVDVIRHLKLGRRVSNAALVGGTAAAAYGVHRARGQKTQQVAKAERDTQRYHGALAGAGGTAAATSIAGERILRSQGHKWAARRDASLAGARKIIPNMKPTISDSGVTRNPKVLAGKSKLQAEAAGRFRGAAAQENYFAHVYGRSAKMARKIRNPALAAAAVGGGGLLLAHKKEHKEPVAKNAGPFGVVHKAASDRRDAAATAGAGAGGYATFRGAQAGLRRGSQAGDAKLHSGYDFGGLRSTAREHRRKYRVTASGAGPKAGEYLRAYPKALPGWKAKRALGHLSGGRGKAIGAAAVVVPAAGALALEHRKGARR